MAAAPAASAAALAATAARAASTTVAAATTAPTATAAAVAVVEEIRGELAVTGGASARAARAWAFRVLNREGAPLPPDVAPYLRAEWGYAYTVHKSQGSEFPVVFIVVERSVRPWTPLGRRWLYTAVTRAQIEATLLA